MCSQGYALDIDNILSFTRLWQLRRSQRLLLANM